MDFSQRSEGPELLDSPDIPAEDLRQNLHELSIINQWLGGHKTTLSGFFALAKPGKKITICEIGCGGGDNLKAIENKTNTELFILGIDINPDCIHFTRNVSWRNKTHFQTNDFRKSDFDLVPDILFCSLFCHHFKDDELVEMFQWMSQNSRTGFFINDLHRHPLAFYSIKLLTMLFSKSYLVKNDAPLSVRRGFKKKELECILAKAGIKKYTLQWRWAFRWLIVVRP
jgi:2-polyprenyl-3-methyl-5-hydroxy-6-metoxy-1,4-benzoquinol methylase